jgi:large subunit ribosomal protein L31
MKTETHPESRYVIFKDNASGAEFLILSTIHTKQTGKYDGKEYPMVEVEISSASHPFYTGLEKSMDVAGRVERFKSRESKKAPAKKKAK